MNKQLFSALSICAFFFMFGASGQVSAISEADFAEGAIGTYEGELTWNGGKAGITTSIFVQGNTLAGKGKFQDGSELTLGLIGNDLSVRGLMFHWKGASGDWGNL